MGADVLINVSYIQFGYNMDVLVWINEAKCPYPICI